MNKSVARINPKKVTVIVESEDGMTYQYNLGDGSARLVANIEVNTEFVDSHSDSLWGVPVYRHPAKREFRLTVNY